MITKKIGVDITNTDAYSIAYEELNNEIIKAVEEHYSMDWEDISLTKRENAANKIQHTLKITATIDTNVLIKEPR